MNKSELTETGLTSDANTAHAAGEEDEKKLTKALQSDLSRMLNALMEKGEVMPEVSDGLQAWIKTVGIIDLSDWLGRAEWPDECPGYTEGLRDGQYPDPKRDVPVFREMGWKKVNIETLRKRTFAVTREKQVYEELYGYADPPESPTLPDGSDDPDVFGPDTVKCWMFAHEWILEMCLFNDPEKNWLAVLAEPWFSERVAEETDRIKHNAVAKFSRVGMHENRHNHI